MCNMVYNEFNDDMQWPLFVLAPYDFIPKSLLDNNLFMKQWNENNVGTVINVNNNNEIYYNNVETYNRTNQKIVKTYHTVNGDKVGHRKEVLYYKDSDNIESEDNYVDNKLDGTVRTWYNNDQHTEGQLRYTERAMAQPQSCI